MNGFEDDKKPKCDGDEYVKPGPKDLQVQLVISLSLGVSAFLAFCVRTLLIFLVPVSL